MGFRCAGFRIKSATWYKNQNEWRKTLWGGGGVKAAKGRSGSGFCFSWLRKDYPRHPFWSPKCSWMSEHTSASPKLGPAASSNVLRTFASTAPWYDASTTPSRQLKSAQIAAIPPRHFYKLPGRRSSRRTKTRQRQVSKSLHCPRPSSAWYLLWHVTDCASNAPRQHLIGATVNANS